MSQITRCPSCATTFRVVPDQLRISEGWVRCGQCKEVFDASANMLVAPPPALLPDVSLTDATPPPAKMVRVDSAVSRWGEAASAPSAETQAPSVAPRLGPGRGTWVSSSWPEEALEPAFDTLKVPQPDVPPFLARDHAVGVGTVLEDPLPACSAMPVEPAVDAPGSPGGTSSVSVGIELPVQAASAAQLGMGALLTPGVGALAEPEAGALIVPVTPDADAEPARSAGEDAGAMGLPEVAFPLGLAEGPTDSPPVALREASRLREVAVAEPDEEGDSPDDLPDVGFVRDAQRAAFWRRPFVRGMLVLLALAAVLGLLVQVAVQERYRLVSADPRLRPWLVALCEPMGCSWNPPRQISDVVIDSSAFNKARGDSYLLALTLKNRSGLALEMPAIELTLTDAQDQAIVRKVLLPADLGAEASIAAHQEWMGSVPVVVTTGGGRVAGYRLLAFYP